MNWNSVDYWHERRNDFTQSLFQPESLPMNVPANLFTGYETDQRTILSISAVEKLEVGNLALILHRHFPWNTC